MRKRTERGYGAAARLLWETSRPLAAAVALYALAASVLPILVLFAAGHLVGDVPTAARHGLNSHAGHRMFVALGLTGAAYAGTLLLGPAQSALSSAVKWRLVYRTQDRLIAAVSRPVGIGHLEDPMVLDDLALAQGQLVNQMTADAPMTLALVISNRASGLIACGVLASLQWWLGLGMLVMWTIVRRPQLRLIREGGRLYSGNTEVFRRALYLQRLAVQPDVATESRVFGLGGWKVLIDGTPLADIDLDAWRSRTAATFQDFIRFELLAQETVGVGDLERIDDQVALAGALRRADAGAVVDELRDGLSTPVGRSFTDGQDLSGGQWQRLALARGMMRELPLLLILDEPTASLDAIAEAALFERYLEARTLASRSGAITLLVSHRFSTVRTADLIVVLEHGRVAAAGEHATLIKQGGLYAELYELQARAYR